MSDLISRQAAIDAISSMFAPTPVQKDMVEDCLEIIENFPSKVDGKSDLQSEHKNGEWLETEFLMLRECSCCHMRWGKYDIENFTFCPNCGAKMGVE